MRDFKKVIPTERGIIIAKLYHNMWYNTDRFDTIMNLLNEWEADPIKEAKYLHEIHDSVDENDLIK